MRISTRGRYALQAMVVLAGKSGNEPVMLKDIAQEANVTEGYLQQLFIALRSGNLVVGIKGAVPGYMLARPSQEISVGEILRRMESSFTTTECLDDDDCDRKDHCVARTVWGGLKNEIDAFVDSISLLELANRYNSAKTVSNTTWSYSI